MRKMASIRQISEIQPIEGADVICVALVDGWKVVVKIGEYSVGDEIIFLEIDSFIPTEISPYLTKNAAMPKEYNGVRGERLRTVKLRGVISQGLIIPLDTMTLDGVSVRSLGLPLGSDVSEMLGIQKWEPPITGNLAGNAKGNFPTQLVPKTDQERCQNMFRDISRKPDATYEVTLKIDGSSMTILRWEDEIRCCSRNLELKISEENAQNAFVNMTMSIQDRIPNGYAFQGELWGEGIQGNKEGIKGRRFSVFDVYDITNQRRLSPMERRTLCAEIGLEHIPVIDECAKAPNTLQELLDMADGPSIFAKMREGLVWKCNEDPNFTYKVISNRWLLKNE